MSQKKIKYTISLAALLLVVLLGFLLITRFGIPIGEKLNVADDSCKMHKNTPDPNCETCYPRPEYEKDTQSIAISETRIRESYKPDTLYIQTANVECVSRGTYKRWGIMTVHDTRFNSRITIERQLIRQEGDTTVMQVRFSENFMVGIFTDVKEAKIQLSQNLQTVLNGLSVVSIMTGQPEGDITLRWLPVAQETVNKLLGNDLIKTVIGPFVSSENAKMFNSFGELQGKKFKITWKQGEGVTDVKEIDCETNAREKQYLYSLSIIPDVLMFPDFEKKPGEQWKVDAKDFGPFLDSSINAKISGSVNLKRKADELGDSPVSHKAVFSVDGGSFCFDRSIGKQGSKGFTYARWSPRGECKYDFSSGIFTEGKLTGEMTLQNKGIDLFIFEMVHTEKPEFQVQYVGETQAIEGENQR